MLLNLSSSKYEILFFLRSPIVFFSSNFFFTETLRISITLFEINSYVIKTKIKFRSFVNVYVWFFFAYLCMCAYMSICMCACLCVSLSALVSVFVCMSTCLWSQKKNSLLSLNTFACRSHHVGWNQKYWNSMSKLTSILIFELVTISLSFYHSKFMIFLFWSLIEP